MNEGKSDFVVLWKKEHDLINLNISFKTKPIQRVPEVQILIIAKDLTSGYRTLTKLNEKY